MSTNPADAAGTVAVAAAVAGAVSADMKLFDFKKGTDKPIDTPGVLRGLLALPQPGEDANTASAATSCMN